MEIADIRCDRERAVAEHRALLDLCRARRDAETVGLLRLHIDHICQGLLDHARRRLERASA